MAEFRLKITPRARRVCKENGLDTEGLSLAGTGYDGGICERDILEYLRSRKVKASPLARAVAGAEGIDLEALAGTGSGGKIMKADVLAAVCEQKPAASVTSPVAVGQVQAGSFAESGSEGAARFTEDGKEILEAVPYAGVRKIIGERLAHSKFTAPHLYFTQKVNVEKLLAVRKQVNEAQDHKTSVTDFIAKAVVQTLQKYPEMNAALCGEEILQYKTVNLGIAVASPTGLIVPVVKSAEKMGVVEISKTANPLFKKAREGKLAPNEYTGGTFTISNLGMFGIENFTAIINPPEAGILSISSTKDEPLVVVNKDGSKEIAIKPMMNICLTVDHRIIDGLLAAQFVTEVKKKLESPIGLLV